MPLPDFLVIGAPKAGTTALHAALARHPGLYLSPVKEPKFFLTAGERPRRSEHRGPGDAHSRLEWVWRRERYEALFAGAPPGTVRGESTPFYLWDRAAHERIARTVPGARLIAIVRDPVDRAYSNWAHLWADGLEPIPDFMEACAAEEERVERGFAPFWRYKGLGRYGEQLEHLYSVFPREQVHVLRYRELVEAPGETLDRICRFLGVEPGRIGLAPSENVSTWVGDTAFNAGLRGAMRAGAWVGSGFPPQAWRRASRPLLRALKRTPANRPDLTEEQRARLVAHFAPDVALLERLTGHGFNDWLGHRTGSAFSVRAAAAQSRAS
jgi:hypothetical protein